MPGPHILFRAARVKVDFRARGAFASFGKDVCFSAGSMQSCTLSNNAASSGGAMLQFNSTGQTTSSFFDQYTLLLFRVCRTINLQELNQRG